MDCWAGVIGVCFEGLRGKGKWEVGARMMLVRNREK